MAPWTPWTPWTPDELARISAPEMFDLSAELPDGTAPKTVSIWAVAVGGRLFVRSYNGTAGSWYGPALASGRGRVSAGGVTKEVDFAPVADEETNTAVDAAYRAKYADSPYAAAMSTGPVRGNTLEVRPRG